MTGMVGRPARGANGRRNDVADAAAEKVKSIVPDCSREEIQAALQQSLGDADAAVLALMDRPQWEQVEKKKKKPAARPDDKSAPRNGGRDFPYRENDRRNYDRPPRGGRGRGSDRGDLDAPPSRGRGRGGRGSRRGPPPGDTDISYNDRQEQLSPVQEYGSSPDLSYNVVPEDNAPPTVAYVSPSPQRPVSSAVVPGSSVSWASKVKERAAPAQIAQPEQHIDDDVGDDDQEYVHHSQDGWGMPHQDVQQDQPAPDNASGDPESFGNGFSREATGSAWASPGPHAPNWSTSANQSVEIPEPLDASKPYDAPPGMPATSQFTDSKHMFDLQSLGTAMPAVSSYTTDSKAPTAYYGVPPDAQDSASNSTYSQPPALSSTNQLDKLFPPQFPTTQPQANDTEPSANLPTSYANTQYSQYSQAATVQQVAQQSPPTQQATQAPPLAKDATPTDLGHPQQQQQPSPVPQQPLQAAQQPSQAFDASQYGGRTEARAGSEATPSYMQKPDKSDGFVDTEPVRQNPVDDDADKQQAPPGMETANHPQQYQQHVQQHQQQQQDMGAWGMPPAGAAMYSQHMQRPMVASNPQMTDMGQMMPGMQPGMPGQAQMQQQYGMNPAMPAAAYPPGYGNPAGFQGMASYGQTPYLAPGFGGVMQPQAAYQTGYGASPYQFPAQYPAGGHQGFQGGGYSKQQYGEQYARGGSSGGGMPNSGRGGRGGRSKNAKGRSPGFSPQGGIAVEQHGQALYQGFDQGGWGAQGQPRYGEGSYQQKEKHPQAAYAFQSAGAMAAFDAPYQGGHFGQQAYQASFAQQQGGWNNGKGDQGFSKGGY